LKVRSTICSIVSIVVERNKYIKFGFQAEEK